MSAYAGGATLITTLVMILVMFGLPYLVQFIYHKFKYPSPSTPELRKKRLIRTVIFWGVLILLSLFFGAIR